MSQIPTDRHYTKTHEWVMEQPAGVVRVGITDHAQSALGDLVFIELPDLGRQVAAQEACAVVESVKTASDIYSPLSGEITAINTALNDTPEIVNNDAYQAGWLFELRPDHPEQLNELLNSTAYSETL
jgi:glycine cleavage system H protein